MQALVRPFPLLVAPAHKPKQRRREGGSNSQQQQQHKHKQTRKPVKVRLTPHAHTYIRTVKYLLSRFCLLLAWKIKKQAEGNTCGKELDERTTTKQQEKQNKTNQLRASGEKQNKTVKNLHAKAEIIIILSTVCVCVCAYFLCGMCGSHKG